jgi:hypothetical protein
LGRFFLKFSQFSQNAPISTSSAPDTLMTCLTSSSEQTQLPHKKGPIVIIRQRGKDVGGTGLEPVASCV